MSYSVRDDNPILGAGAQIAFGNGATGPVLARIQAVEPVVIFGDAGNFTTGHKYSAFIAPLGPTAGVPALGTNWQIIAGVINVGTASSSGTLAIEICPSGTADGSGNNVLSTTNTSLASSGTGVGGNAPAALTLNSNIDNLIITPGGRINFIFGGTLTSLVNLNCTLYVARVS